MKKDRLVAFTDAVLAIVMTILVLELDKPDSATLEAFLAIKQSFFAYFLSFCWLGSLWMSLHMLWDKAELVSKSVIVWNLAFLFFSSFVPYATGLMSSYYDSVVVQAFYGIVVIATTVCCYFLHKALDEPNKENSELLAATANYRRILLPDIVIKAAGLVLTILVYPKAMAYSVLIAAIYIFIVIRVNKKKKKRS